MAVWLCVFVQDKETTEEEDEVAVGMEKGFMDEFFEQVCFFHNPDLSVSVSHYYLHLLIKRWITCDVNLCTTIYLDVMSPNTQSICVGFFRAL